MSSRGTCRVYIRVVDSSVCPKAKAWSTSFQVRFLSDHYSIHSICWYSIHWNSSSAFAAFNFQICKHSFDKSNKRFVIFCSFFLLSSAFFGWFSRGISGLPTSAQVGSLSNLSFSYRQRSDQHPSCRNFSSWYSLYFRKYTIVLGTGSWDRNFHWVF